MDFGLVSIFTGTLCKGKMIVIITVLRNLYLIISVYN